MIVMEQAVAAAVAEIVVVVFEWAVIDTFCYLVVAVAFFFCIYKLLY
jgi:hypothetical protein